MSFALQSGSLVPIVLAWLMLVAICSYAVDRMRRWAEARSMIDVPVERSSHVHPTPRGGGLVIVVAVILGWIVSAVAGTSYDIPFLMVIVGSLMVAAVSFADDLTQAVSVPVRGLVHLAAAVIGVSGIYLNSAVTIDVAIIPPIETTIWLLPVLVICCMAFTNFFNFMDGIDSLASIQAIFAALGWMILGTFADAPVIAVTGGLIAAASLGFLIHNWPPARIFMGDVGSTFLGYLFALLCVYSSTVDPRLPLSGVLLVWPFVFDSTFTLIRRLLRGERIWSPHRSHLYQRLVISGWSHRRVSMLYLVGFLIGLGLAIGWFSRVEHIEWIIMIVLGLGAAGVWALTIACERISAGDVVDPAKAH